MTDDTKDGERERERQVYVVIHNGETEITSHQTAAWTDLCEHTYSINKSTTFKGIQMFLKACIQTFFRLKIDTLILTAFWSAFKFNQINCFVISVLTTAPIQALNM